MPDEAARPFFQVELDKEIHNTTAGLQQRCSSVCSLTEEHGISLKRVITKFRSGVTHQPDGGLSRPGQVTAYEGGNRRQASCGGSGSGGWHVSKHCRLFLR